MNRQEHQRVSNHRALNQFLQEQFVMSVTVLFNQDPSVPAYPFSCFFAFDPDRTVFCYLSNSDSRHAKAIGGNTVFSTAVIHTSSRDIAHIQGLQMLGHSRLATPEEKKGLARIYHNRYPDASQYLGELYVFIPEFIKFTDNMVEFGSKTEFGEIPSHDSID